MACSRYRGCRDAEQGGAGLPDFKPANAVMPAPGPVCCIGWCGTDASDHFTSDVQ